MAGLDNTFKGFSAGAGTGNPWVTAGTTLAGAAGDLWSWLSSRNSKKQQQMQQPGMAGSIAAHPGSNGLAQISNFNPQQQQLQGAAGNEALRLLQGGGPVGFQQIEDQARANFQTKTVPSLAERFGGQGMERGSSALTGQLAAAGSGLDRDLAALKYQYGQKQLGPLLNAALKPSTTFLNQEGQQGPGMFEQFAGDTSQWLPQLFQMYMDLKQKSGQPASEEEWQQVVQQFEQNQQQDTGSIVSNAQQQAFSPQRSPLFGSAQYQLGGRA